MSLPPESTSLHKASKHRHDHCSGESCGIHADTQDSTTCRNGLLSRGSQVQVLPGGNQHAARVGSAPPAVFEAPHLAVPARCERVPSPATLIHSQTLTLSRSSAAA